AIVVPQALGLHEFQVEAWTDAASTWRHATEVKLAAGQDVTVELEEGARILEDRSRRIPRVDRGRVKEAAAALRDATLTPADRLGAATDDAVFEPVAELPEADLTRSTTFPVWVDRERAL